MVNELMLIVSTLSSVLASVAALASELRARRRLVIEADDAHFGNRKVDVKPHARAPAFDPERPLSPSRREPLFMPL
jgi:hypothetical protein